MSDQLEALKQLADQGPHRARLSAADVRRLGDRRHRRRQVGTVVGGALAVAVIAGGALLTPQLLASREVPPAGTPSSQVSSAESVPPSSASSVGSSEVVSGSGLGDLRLGMSSAQLVAIGGVLIGPKYPCGATIPDRPRPGTTVSLAVSESLGLEAIWLAPGLVTPEGIGLASTRAEVAAAYPDLTIGDSGVAGAAVAGYDDRHWNIVFSGDAVSEIGLVLDNATCFG